MGLGGDCGDHSSSPGAGPEGRLHRLRYVVHRLPLRELVNLLRDYAGEIETEDGKGEDEIFGNKRETRSSSSGSTDAHVRVGDLQGWHDDRNFSELVLSGLIFFRGFVCADPDGCLLPVDESARTTTQWDAREERRKRNSVEICAQTGGVPPRGQTLDHISLRSAAASLLEAPGEGADATHAHPRCRTIGPDTNSDQIRENLQGKVSQVEGTHGAADELVVAVPVGTDDALGRECRNEAMPGRPEISSRQRQGPFVEGVGVPNGSSSATAGGTNCETRPATSNENPPAPESAAPEAPPRVLPGLPSNIPSHSPAGNSTAQSQEVAASIRLYRSQADFFPRLEDRRPVVDLPAGTLLNVKFVKDMLVARPSILTWSCMAFGLSFVYAALLGTYIPEWPNEDCREAQVRLPSTWSLLLYLGTLVWFVFVLAHQTNAFLYKKAIRTFDALLVLVAILRVSLGDVLSIWSCNMNEDPRVVLYYLWGGITSVLFVFVIAGLDGWRSSRQTKRFVFLVGLIQSLSCGIIVRYKDSGWNDNARYGLDIFLFDVTPRSQAVAGWGMAGILYLKFLLATYQGRDFVTIRPHYQILWVLSRECDGAGAGHPRQLTSLTDDEMIELRREERRSKRRSRSWRQSSSSSSAILPYSSS